jgi:hypothetical protein
MEDDGTWPICTIGRCDESYPPGRHALGYRTCVKHSQLDPQNAMPPLILQDVNKSNPTVTRRTDFIHDAYADRVVRSELKSNRSYIRLSSIDKEKSHL